MTSRYFRPNLRILRPLALAALAALAACSSPVESEEHLDPVAVEITTTAGVPLAHYANGVWTIEGGAALHLNLGEEVDVRVFFIEGSGERRQLPASGAPITLGVEIEDPGIASYELHGDHGAFVGEGVGTTRAKIQAYHGTHPDYETNPGLPIEVVDHDH